MMIRDVLKALEAQKTAVLAKEIGVGEKKLRDALRSAGYEYHNSGDKGWHYIGEGDQPLEKSLQDFVTVRATTVQRKDANKGTDRKAPKSEIGNGLTPYEVDTLRGMIAEWGTIKGVVDNVSVTRVDVVEANEITRSIDDLFIRTKREIKKEKKMRKTININEGAGKALDDFASKYKVEKQNIIELALYDFFEKYGENYKDRKEESEA